MNGCNSGATSSCFGGESSTMYRVWSRGRAAFATMYAEGAQVLARNAPLLICTARCRCRCGHLESSQVRARRVEAVGDILGPTVDLLIQRTHPCCHQLRPIRPVVQVLGALEDPRTNGGT
eukprot:2973419-Prymnesium_polylepis.1